MDSGIRSREMMELAMASPLAAPPGDPMAVELKSDARPSVLDAARLDSRSPQPLPTREPGVRDVAKAASVSVATVSLVINDHPRISEATRKRVRVVMEQLGYRPNRLAQNLSRRDTRMLCLILPSLAHAFADRYFGELMSGIFDRARKRGYKLMLEQATPDFIEKQQHVELFKRRFVDGVLCLGNSDRHPFLNDFSAAGNYPVIAVNNYFPQWPAVDSVVCDYRGGAEQAMSYLIQLGHRKIGMITGSEWVRTARDIAETHERKLREAGVELLPTWRADGLFTESGGAAAAEQLMHLHPELTAIFAANDRMAIGAIQYLVQSGKSVPGDVSVVGFDDMESAAFVNPALTSVHLPLYEAGVLSCEKLINRIQNSNVAVPSVLPTHLVVRNSSGIAR